MSNNIRFDYTKAEKVSVTKRNGEHEICSDECKGQITLWTRRGK